MRRLVCATHGHCFDGLASATLLTEIVLSQEPSTQCTYLAWGYTGHAPTGELDGDENALLDYRYVPDERLTYYVDHHRTAFAAETDFVHFRRRKDAAPDRFVFDAESVSCTEVLSRLARERGCQSSRLDSLVRWARIVDGALYPSVEDATDLQDPIVKVVQVVSHFGDAHHITRWVEVLRREGLAGLVEDRLVKQRLRTMLPAMSKYNQLVQQEGRLMGRVAFVPLTTGKSFVTNKFQQYAEFPQCDYSVLLSKAGDGYRISVGHNPWCGRSCDVDIGGLCQRYGGGGHAVVGGVALAHCSEVDALRVCGEMIAALRDPKSPAVDPDLLSD